MSKAFEFPLLALSDDSRAELESGLRALTDAESAGTEYENAAAESQRRRESLEAEIGELENCGEAHAADAAARLPALREQLAIVGRSSNRPAKNAGATRIALAGLSLMLADLLKEWHGQIEAGWFHDIQRLYHGLPCTHPSVRLGQFPGYQTLARCLLIDPKNWLNVVDENLPKQAAFVSGIARDILDGKNSFAWIHDSIRPPE